MNTCSNNSHEAFLNLRREKRRYERFIKYLESVRSDTLTFEEFIDIRTSNCHYCNNELSPNYKCTPDIDRSFFRYKLSDRPICSFCKNLKNSSKLSTEEAEEVIKTLIDTRRANASKNSRKNTS